MKRVFVNNRVLQVISATATAVLLIVSNPLASQASGLDHVKTGRIGDNQVSAQYIGTDENSYVFRVEFENPDAQKFSFIIKNDDDVIVYEGQFSDAHFSKTVRLPKDEVVSHPTFIIRAANGEVKRSFTVSRVVTESLVVTKS